MPEKDKIPLDRRYPTDKSKTSSNTFYKNVIPDLEHDLQKFCKKPVKCQVASIECDLYKGGPELMEYQRLGTSDLNVSKMTYGCGMLKNNWSGARDDNETVATIHYALDQGINFFDTADIYDQGYAETLLARALGNHRKDVFIATKVGLRYHNKKYTIDLSKSHIKNSIEQSLRRLKTDAIDLYQAHWPDLINPLSGTFEALNECVEEGKIRYIGIANFELNHLLKSSKYSLITSHQIPLNLFKREYEIQIIPYCYKHNIALIAYAPLANGLLNGQLNQKEEGIEVRHGSHPMFRGETYRKNLSIVDRLQQFAMARHKTIRQLAIAWILAHQSVTTVVCNATNPEKMAEQIQAIQWKLTQEELAQIELLYNIS